MYYKMSHEQLNTYYEESQRNPTEIIFMQVGGFYEAYYFPNDIGCGKQVATLLRIHLTCKRPNDPWTNTNPKFAGFPLNSLNKFLTILNDMKYVVAIYEQEKNNPKHRYLRGKYTENLRMDTESMDEVSVNSKLMSIFLEKYDVIIARKRVTEYKLHYCTLEMNSLKFYFGELLDSSLTRLVEKFFIQNQPSEFMFQLSGNFSVEEEAAVNKIVRENSTNSATLERSSSKNDMDVMLDTIHAAFRHPPSLVYFPFMTECVYRMLQYVKEHLPTLKQVFSVDENPWLVTDSKPFLQCNRDLYGELFLFEVEKDRKMYGHQVKSVYEMFTSSMNSIGKRCFYRKLQYPMTCVSDMEQSYGKIENANTMCSMYRELIDVEYYYIRWMRHSLSELKLATLLQTYVRLEEFYPMLKDFNQDVHERWDITAMSEKRDYLKKVSDTYQQQSEEYQKVVRTLQEHCTKEQELHLTLVPELIGSFYTITNARWKKWPDKKRLLYRVISNQSTTKKVMLHSLEEVFPSMHFTYTQIRKYQRERHEEDTVYFLEQHSKRLESFHKQLGEDSMYSSLAKFFKQRGYTRPSVKEADVFEMTVDQGRHALMEYLHPNDLFTPFSCRMDQNTRGQLLYGVNSSGKSTYMKTMCLLLWLAQCGLWVPAKLFSFSPVSVLFSKFKHMDNLFRKHSTYITEISELNYILDRAQPRSLICLDEFPVGTEIYSSSTLLMSLMEHFVHKKYNFMVTTHIPYIYNFVEERFMDEIQTFHFRMREEAVNEIQLVSSPQDLYDREMVEGPGDTHYGLEIAQKHGLDTTIIDRAYSFRNCIQVTYSNPDPKPSRYNSKLSIIACENCNSKQNLHTHHILPQQVCENQNVSESGFRKNGLYNLKVLCETCHETIHKNGKV